MVIKEQTMHIKAMMVLVLVLILNVQPTAADQDQFKKVFQDLDHEFSTVNRDSDEQKQDFNKFRKVQEEAFQAFRDERDRDFTAFLKAEWEAFAEMQGLVRYTIPKPKVIPKASEVPDDRSVIPKGKNVKPVEPLTTPLPEAVPQPEPIPAPKSEPLTEPRPPLYGTLVEVMFYGLPVKVAYDPALTATIADQADNDAISTYWAKLSQADFESLIRQLGQIKDRLLLNDWGFFQFVDGFVHTIQPDTNSATLLTWFVLTKSGFRVKVGYSRNNIYLLAPTQGTIYEAPYYTLDGTRFYNISYLRNQGKPGTIYTYKKDYPGAERVLTLMLRNTPLTHADKNLKTLNFRYNGQTYNIPASFNLNTVRFYQAYPQTNWEVYLSAPVAPETETSLVRALGKVVQGKSETEAVNMLLRFVQTAFKYQTDDDQFGHEKYMFAEETLFSRYSDCEDRATLFSSLVRRILGLDVIGLLYPGHAATAVKFSGYVAGDAVTVNGERFVVCDPTYINADIGLSMPQFKSVKPEVVRGALKSML
jgi:hypothetical protein